MSPYDLSAPFKCSQGCGVRERSQCHTFRGRLFCPKCRYVGTLNYIGPEWSPRAALREQKDASQEARDDG